MTESMGEVYDRTQEHLGTSDTMIIRTRRRMIDAAKALRDNGVLPPAWDDPKAYAVRTGGDDAAQGSGLVGGQRRATAGIRRSPGAQSPGSRRHPSRVAAFGPVFRRAVGVRRHRTQMNVACGGSYSRGEPPGQRTSQC